MYAFLSVQCVLHALPVSLSLVCLPLWYLLKSINYDGIKFEFLPVSYNLRILEQILFLYHFLEKNCNIPLNSVNLFMYVIVYMEVFILNSSQNFWDKCIISGTAVIETLKRMWDFASVQTFDVRCDRLYTDDVEQRTLIATAVDAAHSSRHFTLSCSIRCVMKPYTIQSQQQLFQMKLHINICISSFDRCICSHIWAVYFVSCVTINKNWQTYAWGSSSDGCRLCLIAVWSLGIWNTWVHIS